MGLMVDYTWPLATGMSYNVIQTCICACIRVCVYARKYACLDTYAYNNYDVDVS